MWGHPLGGFASWTAGAVGWAGAGETTQPF